MCWPLTVNTDSARSHQRSCFYSSSAVAWRQQQVCPLPLRYLDLKNEVSNHLLNFYEGCNETVKCPGHLVDNIATKRGGLVTYSIEAFITCILVTFPFPQNVQKNLTRFSTLSLLLYYTKFTSTVSKPTSC